MITACNIAEAEQNTNVWPSWDNPRLLLTQLNECYTGLVERYTVCGLNITNVTLPATNRPNKATLEAYKDEIQTIIPYFWDTNAPISNATSITYLSVTGLISSLKLPTNYFAWTPDRGMSGTGGYTNDTTVGHAYGFTNEYTVAAGTNFPGSRTNWYTTDYGIQPIRDILERLQYTTANATLLNSNVVSYADAGIVYFSLHYETNTIPGYPPRLDRDWDYEYVTNLWIENAPVAWPGALLERATEPNDGMVTSHTWSLVSIDSDFSYFQSYDDRDRPGDWWYSYSFTLSGTATVDAISVGYYGMAFNPYDAFKSIYITYQEINPATQDLIWTNVVRQMGLLGYENDMNIGALDPGGFQEYSDGVVNFSDWTYLGAYLSDNKAYANIYTTTNASGVLVPLVTNFYSGRQLYMYGDYPSDYLMSLYFPGTVPTNIFVWDTDEVLAESIIFQKYAPIGSEETGNWFIHTNSSFAMPTNVIDLTVPFDGETDEIEKGWGTSKGVWTVNWFVTNGFTIK